MTQRRDSVVYVRRTHRSCIQGDDVVSQVYRAGVCIVNTTTELGRVTGEGAIGNICSGADVDENTAAVSAWRRVATKRAVNDVNCSGVGKNSAASVSRLVSCKGAVGDIQRAAV